MAAQEATFMGPPGRRPVSFTDQKPFVVTEEEIKRPCQECDGPDVRERHAAIRIRLIQHARVAGLLDEEG